MAYTTAQSVHVLDTNFRAAPSGRAADGVLRWDLIQELDKEQFEKLSAGRPFPISDRATP